ncbi:Scramblase-domain-containing protein [Coprinopsis marcescibilis]|uniref:Phospholipid scramblase n=1 Tax=Coprinopsis marcescibilis TaxID=230819 RepID=A0A5C3LAD2_COPMA|nr:Scramblase-domain-containing protein [Coprinopsis marcescibilis]
MLGLATRRACSLSKPLCRTYAFSRLPRRPTGASRKRPEHGSTGSRPNTKFESEASSEESDLWRAAQRPPSSDPKKSLEALLHPYGDTLVVERQIEMLNIFVGFEQANKYSISDQHGQPLGFVVEVPRGILTIMARQAFATHRPFKAVIMDTRGTPLLWLRRPFAWINSRMFVQRLDNYDHYTPDDEPVLDTFAEVQQKWHPWRRQYDLFLREPHRRILTLASEPQPEPEPTGPTFHQFTKIDSGFLAWRFPMYNAYGQEIAVIDRAFRGFGREIFTDTGRYLVKFKPEAGDVHEQDSTSGMVRPSQRALPPLSLDQRALCLATAVNIDFDYFSRHSHIGGGGLFHAGPLD